MAKQKRYHRSSPARSAHTVAGRFQFNPRGFGFLIPDDGSPDVFIPGSGVGGAVHGDKVKIEVSRFRGKSEGKVREVLARGIQTVVGKLRVESGTSAWVTPFGRDFPYPVAVSLVGVGKLPPDPVVAVTIDWKKSTAKSLHGKIQEVLGSLQDPTIDSLIVMYRNVLPPSFSKAVVLEAEGISNVISEAELHNRKDLRNLSFFTIDGADARDHDDAIALDPDGSVWVAIADVSHYVKPNSLLDAEACERGNSYYFPDRVIPMLPERLSNDLCSLRPNEARLVQAIQMTFSSDGTPTHARLCEGIIRSRARLTYEGVDQHDYPKELAPAIKTLRKLTDTLFHRRMLEGGIDFDLSETKVILNEKGVVTAMARRERTPSQRIVEELMLSANRGVATLLSQAGYPVVFRVHDRPEPKKLADFFHLLRAYGFTMKVDPEVADPRALDRILQKFRNDPRGKVFSRLALRSMRQAYYSVSNIGHYGLGFENYAHFTSPIRRYADLVLHRIVWRYLHKKPSSSENLFPAAMGSLEHVSMLTSDRERVAQKAEREIQMLKGIRFLQRLRGKTFPGMIMGMISQGFFVELADHAVEGFVHIDKLPKDRYTFQERELTLKGQRRGKAYRMGDRLTVKVDDASIEEFRVEFSPVQV